MKRLLSFLIIATSCCSYAGHTVAVSKVKRTPASLPVKHLVVTDSSFNDRLAQALSRVKDPAVTVETLSSGLRHVTLMTDGQSVSCVDGVQQDSPGVGHSVSECDFDLAVAPSADIEGPFSGLIIQALGLYRASKPGDALVSQNQGPGGSMVQLGSIDPTQSLLASSSIQLAAGFPRQALVCHALTPVRSPVINDCSFYLYEALDKSDANSLDATLSADSKYAPLLKADEDFIAAQGFVFSGLQVWRALGGEIKALATYTKSSSHSGTPGGRAGLGRILPRMSLVIEAETNPATDGKGYRVSGVYLGR